MSDGDSNAGVDLEVLKLVLVTLLQFLLHENHFRLVLGASLRTEATQPHTAVLLLIELLSLVVPGLFVEEP